MSIDADELQRLIRVEKGEIAAVLEQLTRRQGRLEMLTEMLNLAGANGTAAPQPAAAPKPQKPGPKKKPPGRPKGHNVEAFALERRKKIAAALANGPLAATQLQNKLETSSKSISRFIVHPWFAKDPNTGLWHLTPEGRAANFETSDRNRPNEPEPDFSLDDDTD